MTPGALAPHASPPRKSYTVPSPLIHPPSPPPHERPDPLSHATEDTMRPFRVPGPPSWRATTPAGIVKQVKGGVVHRPGMTPVDGF